MSHPACLINTWNSKQPVFYGCFNCTIPNHYIKNRCLGYQLGILKFHGLNETTPPKITWVFGISSPTLKSTTKNNRENPPVFPWRKSHPRIFWHSEALGGVVFFFRNETKNTGVVFRKWTTGVGWGDPGLLMGVTLTYIYVFTAPEIK